MVYNIDYGMTDSNRLSRPSRYTNKKVAIHVVADMVRAFGRQGWGIVWVEGVSAPDCVARWRDGRRVE